MPYRAPRLRRLDRTPRRPILRYRAPVLLSSLRVLPGRFAVCRLPPDADLPAWASAGATLLCITRTAEELSIVCDEQRVPAVTQATRDWCCLCVKGPLEHDLVGVLAAIAQPLAVARLSIFALSTYDTDYILVRAESLNPALQVLRTAGHRIIE